jgi:hypothetical protein
MLLVLSAIATRRKACDQYCEKGSHSSSKYFMTLSKPPASQMVPSLMQKHQTGFFEKQKKKKEKKNQTHVPALCIVVGGTVGGQRHALDGCEQEFLTIFCNEVKISERVERNERSAYWERCFCLRASSAAMPVGRGRSKSGSVHR